MAALFLSLLFLLSSAASATAKQHPSTPCYNETFYFHNILYNGNNSDNATAAIVGAPAWANTTISAGQNHFGDVVVFNNPITRDNNLGSTPIGWAQGFYFYDNKEVFTAWFAFSAVFNTTERRGTINFAGADPATDKTRDISVIGGTGAFAMARGIATFSTDAVEGDVYFRLRVDVKLYECWNIE